MNEQIFEGYRLSPQQERLWYLGGNGDASAYRSQCAALVEGKINSYLFQTAVNRVISRHEILRTKLNSMVAMSLPLQVIAGRACTAIEEVDLTALTELEQARELKLLYESRRLARVDYLRESPLEVGLARIGESKQIMLVSTGSVWSDKKGLKNVIRDVICEYDGKVVENEEDVQYADVSEIFNTLIESGETKTGREYWGGRAGSKIGERELVTERMRKGGFRPKIEIQELTE
jgi:hypothetical protein